MIRIVAVGCGWVTTNRHVPSIARSRRLRLVGVVDRRPERARALATRLGVPAAADLDDPALGAFEAVSVGTAPAAHHALALAAIERGKHVIVEKPLAPTVAEAREIADRAAARGLVCAVVHNFQFSRAVARARDRAASGRDGALRGILGLQFSNARRRLPEWYRGLPGGLFLDEAPHLYYLARAFLGDARADRAEVGPALGPDDPTPVRLTAHLTGPRAGATLHFEFAAAVSEWQLVVLLERATIACDLFRDIYVRVPDDGRHTSREVLRTSLAGALSHWAGVATSGLRYVRGTLDYGNDEVFRRFADAMASGRAPEGIAAADGVAVVEAMRAALDAQAPARSASSAT